jgi:hypothetical protein
MSKKIIYITEEQEQELVNKLMSESLIVNSAQVSDIVNHLNKFYQAGIDYAGDVGVVFDLMFSGSLFINQIYELEVVHNLLGKKGAILKDIK